MDQEGPYFRPGGTLDPASPSYIERAADRQLLSALLAHEYVYLLDSRQKGKSSLVARTIEKLQEAGVTTIKLDLQRIGANVTPDQWYAGILVSVGQQLGNSKELFDYWQAHQMVGPLARFIGTLHEVLLANTSGPIVFFIDEIDFVRALPFSTDEFFAGIRDCYNRRSESESFQRLTFCLVGVATPGQLIRNPEVTPFNVGQRIELSDFGLEEIRSYGAELETPERDGAQLIARVHYWLNGHPYLTQVLCSHIAADKSIRSPGAVDRLVRAVFLSPESRQSEPNFADVERRILEPNLPDLAPDESRAQVLDLYGKLLRNKSVEKSAENPIVATLRLAGVGLEDRHTLVVRNRLYRIVFNEKWRRQSLPDAESRRVRGAARLAVLRTALVAGAIVIGTSSVAVAMWRLSRDKSRANIALSQQSRELERAAGEREQALKDLKLRNTELTEISDERQRALSRLETQTRELLRLSQEKEEALVSLRKKTEDLTYSDYIGKIAAAESELQINRWTELPSIIKETENNPNRGWEWGHFALAVHYGTREDAFTKWSVIESRANGDPSVVTQVGVYEIRSGRYVRTLSFPISRPVTPQFRSGNYRVMCVESTRGSAIFDAKTNKQLTKDRAYSTIFDLEPRRRLYLISEPETSDAVQLRTIDGDKLICAYAGPVEARAARILPDGSIIGIFATEKDNVGEVRHWDRAGKLLDSAPSDQQWANYGNGLTVSSDGKMYAAWGHNVKVEIRAVQGHRRICALPDFQRTVTDLRFSDDGRRVLVGCEDGIVYLFEVETGKIVSRLYGSHAAIRSIAFLNSGTGYAALDGRGFLRTWNAVPEEGTKSYLEPGTRATQATVDAKGRALLTVLDDRRLATRDLLTGDSKVVPIANPEQVAVISLAQGCDQYFLARNNGTIERVSGLTLKQAARNRIFSSKPTRIDFLRGAKRLFVATEDRRFALLDSTSLSLVARIEPRAIHKPEDSNGVDLNDTFAFDQETPQFATYVATVGKVQIYSSQTGKLINEWDPGRPVLCMTFVNGGKQLVASLASAWWVRDGQTVIFDVRTGRRSFEFKHPAQTVNLLEYAPKTRRLAGKTSDQREGDRVVYVWNFDTRRLIGELSTPFFITKLSFSPDGDRILTHSANNATRLWDSGTGQELFRLPVNGFAQFSVDGRRIIQLQPDGGVRVWNSLPWRTSQKRGSK
ncbi:MAG: AAA-like domain-containing protein [Armatimonadetes bacterium]|nr:AAA-like domain-containing protein [Armatimonadota bacterium]